MVMKYGCTSSLSLSTLESQLQIRRGEGILHILFFLFLIENICCDPSLEPSQRDGSNEGSQNMFLWRNIENYPLVIPVTPSYLELCRVPYLPYILVHYNI